MLHFANLIRSMEDRYIEEMGKFVKGDISYEIFLELERYKDCMMALKRRFKMLQMKEVKYKKARR